MDAVRIRRAEKVFQCAADLPPSARGPILERECPDDPEMRTYVEALLAHHDSGMSGFFQTPAAPFPVDASSIPTPCEPTPCIPTYIGRYRIKGVLGQGGMGVVYQAEQDQPRRTVALKTIRAGVMSPSARRRFESETAALRRLQHPGIAQIFEVGTVDDESGSRPYFVMEFVDGRTLTDYAREARLGTRQRLALMTQVCYAVHHAHQRGVLHRDLKPANILVDGSCHVKILDFGVAKATDADLYATTLRTDIGQLIGTIPYMSPEQVCGDPHELDTRSDVYSLGVVAYELLSGRLPHDLSHTAIPEAVRRIREVDPTPLSSVDRIFRGDIETIILKALEKDRSRRYQSASELAADIERFLTDQPVLARPASTIYSLRKLAARHKTLSACLATLIAVLGAFGMWMGLLYQQAEHLRRNANHLAHRARQTQLFLERMLSSIDPAVAKGKDTSLIRGILTEAAEKVDVELADQPEAQADIRSTIGEAYRSVGLARDAQIQLEAALAIRRRILGNENDAVAATLRSLAECVAQQGDRVRAESLAREALALRRKQFDGGDVRVAEALQTLGWIVSELSGNHAEASALLRESLEIVDRVAGREHPNYAAGLHRLAVVLWRWQQFPEAESIAREALESMRHAYGPEHPSVANVLDLLGQVLTYQKQFTAAEPILRESIEMHRRLYGEEHPVFVTALNSLSQLHTLRGDYAAAEPLARQCVELTTRLRGEDSHETAMAWMNLAALLDDAGNYAEACKLYRVADERFRRVFALDHPYLHSPMTRLAKLLDKMGDHEAAEPLWRQVAAETRQAFPPGHSHHRLVAAKTAGLGRCLRDLQRCPEAEVLLLESYEQFHTAGGARHKDTLAGAEALVRLYEQCGPAEKATEFRQILATTDAELPDRAVSNTRP